MKIHPVRYELFLKTQRDRRTKKKAYSSYKSIYSVLRTLLRNLHSAHGVYSCVPYESLEPTAATSLCRINWLVFITETEGVYCAVRTGSLYIILRSAHTDRIYVFCVEFRTNSYYFPIQH